MIGATCGAIDKAGAIVYERHFHSGDKVNEHWIERCRGQLHGALSVLEQRAQTPWFLGRRFSQADVTTGVMLGYLLLRLADEFSETRYPELARHRQACEELPCFALARPAPDEVMPARQ
jgi:glutathione S-transferase